VVLPEPRKPVRMVTGIKLMVRLGKTKTRKIQEENSQRV
jgi:hypothetical protein